MVKILGADCIVLPPPPTPLILAPFDGAPYHVLFGGFKPPAMGEILAILGTTGISTLPRMQGVVLDFGAEIGHGESGAQSIFSVTASGTALNGVVLRL